MPISRQEFDAGLDSNTIKFFKTFSDNPDKAFTLEELAKEWKVNNWDAITILVLLQSKELVKGKLVGLNYYYYIFK
ncbi:MAG: hypothetical protein P8Y18_04755 [Candidatus Bathyarchaeota archaeon]